MKVVILAGDIGRKLWPLTREEIPKAFLPLYGQLTYLVETLVRIVPLVETPDDIYLVLPEKSTESLDLSVIKMDESHILLEPTYKGTANSMAMATQHLHEIDEVDKNELILFIPVDHFVDPIELFLLHIYNSLEMLIEADRLIAYVSEPSELVYDLPTCLLNHSKTKVCGEPVDVGSETVTTMTTPVEKIFTKTDVDHDRASYFNVTGIYVSTLNLWQEIFKNYYPFETINTETVVVKTGWFSKDYITQWDEDDFNAKWSGLPTTTFESNILPKLVDDKLVYGCDLNLVSWYKVDSWSSVKYLLFDSGLFSLGHNPELHQVDAQNNYIFKPIEKQVALFGVDNLIIIDSNDALLIGSAKSIDENL